MRRFLAAEAPASATPGILQDADPLRWRSHRFGLPPERWESLRDKSFWVTGAGTGYGRSLAVALAAAEAQVFLSGRREEKLLESLEEMKSLRIPSGKCRAVPFDLSDPEQIFTACREIEAGCPALYALVNNAAVPSSNLADPLQKENPEFWDKIMNVNVRAPWLLTRKIFPHMMKGRRARVLFVTSGAGWAFTRGYGLYNISKAALNNLAGSMAEELSAGYPEADVQVNALSPGEARTEMNPYSTASPYAAVSMALALLSHPEGGPNGKFFHRDGRHLEFAHSTIYEKSLF